MPPKKKKNGELSDIIKDLKNEVRASNMLKQFGAGLPSIIEFVEQERWLGMSHYPQPVILRPMQRILLKCFYRGSPGNENLQLDPEEIELIKKHGLTEEENGDVLSKWDNETTFRELVLVWGRRCLSEDATIVDPDTGIRWRIGDLWDYGKTEMSSWTYNEQSKKMTKIKGCNLISQGIRDVYEVELSSGHRTEATDNHPFLTKDGWKQVKDIRVGEKIALSPNIPFFGQSTQLGSSQAALLGYLSSSKMSKINNMLVVNRVPSDIEADFKDQIANSFENADVKSPSGKTQSMAFFDHASSVKDCKDIRTLKDCKSIHQLAHMSGLLNKSAEEKHVPVRIMRSSKQCVSAYLSRLFSVESELTFSKKSGRVYAKIECELESHSLAESVHHLLHRFGIFSAAKYNRKVEGKIRHTVTISKLADIKLFLRDIGYVDRGEEVSELLSLLSHVDIDEKIEYVSLQSKRKIGKKRTFDLQVSHEEHKQNFIADGFIAHNSGKDFIVSIMALYEAMRLLETPGGNPYATYNLSSAAPMTILTIANAAPQAKILFREVRDKVNRSPYFQDKVGHMTDDMIYLLTPHDKDSNKKLKERGLDGTRGSVQIKAGHSNSNSLVGLSCFAVMFDEIGTYKITAGSSSGDQLYHNLVPATMTYVRKEPVLKPDGTPELDENGNEKVNRVLDGKVICISTPRGKDGILYDLYSNANEVPHRLMMRAPTWAAHPDLSEADLLKGNPDMGDAKFAMEFGAEFFGTAGESFFSSDDVDACFRSKNVKKVMHGLPGVTYFAHLDPATSSHNYALCICHQEMFVDSKTGKRDFRIIVDHLHHWTPTGDSPIMVEEVDKYMIEMHKRFHFGLVTYDQWNSKNSINNLRKHGVPAKETPFSKQYKQQIYDNLYQLAINKKILIPEYKLLYHEMKNLQRKWTESGYKVLAKKDADIDTDDMCDALAGACYNAIERGVSRLPQGKMVNMPVSPNGNSQVWRSMQGTPYGYGSGQQVANNMRNRSGFRSV